MSVSPSRRLAHEILVAVETRDAYASELLHGPGGRGLSAADRRLATEIVLGVLRWRGQLDFVIEGAAARPLARMNPEVRAALRMGVYQLRFLQRVPASAAVHESVELAKRLEPRAAGFVNAILRRCPLDPIAALLASTPAPYQRWAVELSHPAWLLERWRDRYGEGATRQIADYDNAVPPVSVRADGGAAGAESLRVQLRAHSIETLPGLLVAGACRVAASDAGKLARLRESGAPPHFWIQDEGSQLVARLLRPPRQGWMLDACAAPGAKSALLHALAPRTQLVSLDIHPHRARLLRRLLPDKSVWVIAADAAAKLPLSQRFDRILVDAPCTGTGTLARNPEIRWRLTPGDPARLQRLQLDLLRNLLGALRPGGRLVYSVCSLESEEGEAVIGRLRREESGYRLVSAGETIDALIAEGDLTPAARACGQDAFVRILPAASTGADGFFAAIIEKAPRKPSRSAL